MVLVEIKVDAAGRTLTVFFDEELGDICLFLIIVVLMIIIGSVDKHNDVGILLDRAGITKVGKNRLRIVATGDITRELSKGDDGDFELAGEGF